MNLWRLHSKATPYKTPQMELVATWWRCKHEQMVTFYELQGKGLSWHGQLCARCHKIIQSVCVCVFDFFAQQPLAGLPLCCWTGPAEINDFFSWQGWTDLYLASAFVVFNRRCRQIDRLFCCDTSCLKAGGKTDCGGGEYCPQWCFFPWTGSVFLATTSTGDSVTPVILLAALNHSPQCLSVWGTAALMTIERCCWSAHSSLWRLCRTDELRWAL